MEQKWGPHIEQKWASLAPSAGRVSSWNSRAVSGSSERLNWSAQRNSKRALLSASSHSRARGLDHDLAVVLPRDRRQLAERVQLGELGLVVGVRGRARAQAVAKRERDVVRRP